MHTIVTLVMALTAVQGTAYDSVFEQLKNLAPRRDAVASVKNVVLKRDAMELRLDSGQAYLLTPVSGRTVGIAFVGAGTLTFQPPLLVERVNLERVLGDSGVSGPITAAAFLFADSTAEDLQRQLTFGSGGGGQIDNAHNAVNATLDYLVEGRERSARPSLTTALLNHSTTAYFAAYIKRAHGESVMIEYDPEQTEEVALYRRGKMLGQRVETVCRFQRSQDLAANVSEADEHPEPLSIGPYDIDATIEGNLKFSAHATLQLSGRIEPQRWAVFYLYEELDVDSVSSGGQALTFFRRDHAAPLWVRFPTAIGPGDTLQLRVSYHGSLIGLGSLMEGFIPREYLREFAPVLDSWTYLKSELLWYPRYGGVERSDMRLTFHTPRGMKFASIGRLMHADTSDKVITSQWVTENPTNFASFNIGKFEEFEIRDPRIPPVTVHVNAEAHRVLQTLFPHNRDAAAENVGSDIANSLSFFTEMFGPPPFQHYYATETPQSHGLSLPGLIRLSWETYLSYSSKGSDESFRAHEMAHQWWYYGVQPAGYRDAWLSEGFAEFAGLWYMQLILKDNDKYLKKLRDSRDEIRRERGKASPIGLGMRAAENWRGNYELTTYQKGAWVLHMLRNMMIDSRNMSEARFQAMMRDYYMTYRGKRASTLDFQHVVERHVGQPMDWFFDEWVYGTDVPTYTFAWKSEQDSAGFPTHIRVRQTDVPPTFGMYVPLLIKFDKGESFIRVLVRGETTEATVRLPARPKSIEFNPFESVLADVKTEGWD